MIVNIYDKTSNSVNTLNVQSVIYHSNDDSINLSFYTNVSYKEREKILSILESFKERDLDLTANDGIIHYSFKLKDVRFNELQGRIIMVGEDFLWN